MQPLDIFIAVDGPSRRPWANYPAFLRVGCNYTSIYFIFKFIFYILGADMDLWYEKMVLYLFWDLGPNNRILVHRSYNGGCIGRIWSIQTLKPMNRINSADTGYSLLSDGDGLTSVTSAVYFKYLGKTLAFLDMWVAPANPVFLG
jgi:hypothetical protein